MAAALNVCSWIFEIFVGILFALAAHTALTRLRTIMFFNLVQQVLVPCVASRGILSPLQPTTCLRASGRVFLRLTRSGRVIFPADQ